MGKQSAMVTMNEPVMLRTFRVVYLAGELLSVEEVVGNSPLVLPDGSLQILRYKGEVPWTVKLYAAGVWQSVTVDVPSDEDLGALEHYNVMRATRDRAMAQDTGSTRQ